MSRYRIGLTTLNVLVGLFTAIAIFSSMVGVGLLQGFLILVSFILLLGIFIGGIASLGAKDFWWNYFKPDASVPVAWGLFHLAFVLMLPEVPPKLWALHWKIIITIELCAFVTCWILNKKEPFEERFSRKLLMAQYIHILIVAILMLGCRLFFGEFAADLNRETLYRLVGSEVELTAGNIEKHDKKHKAELPLAELNRLSQESKKRSLSKTELQRVERLKTRIKEIYAVPDDEKINWRKLLSFGKSAEAGTEDPSPERRLSGIFKLPKDGTRVNKDVNGLELPHFEGEVGHFRQLGPIGEFVAINREIASLRITQPVYTTGPATSDGKVDLMATGGKDIIVEVTIILPRS